MKCPKICLFGRRSGLAKHDNTNLEPEEVADIVIKKFGLVANEKEEKEYRFGV